MAPYLKQFSGEADWRLIADIKQAVAIPVIGNGDVRRPEQVEHMRSLTGCDGVMIGRAAMGNPWIFQQARQLAEGDTPHRPSARERFEVILRHLHLNEEYHQGRLPVSGVRSLLMWYSRGLSGSTRVRAALSRCRKQEAMIRICEDFLGSLEDSMSELQQSVSVQKVS